jgi:hypothetical protein
MEDWVILTDLVIWCCVNTGENDIAKLQPQRLVGLQFRSTSVGVTREALILSLLFEWDLDSLALLHLSLEPTVETTNPFMEPNKETSSLKCLILGKTLPGGNESQASFDIDKMYDS